jgi:competence protein ComEC
VPDPKVHFLNAQKGDCIILEHGSGRVTVIDICCGNLTKVDHEIAEMMKALIKKPMGNYRMCETPTNPIDYLSSKGLTSIFRFILTHPHFDHMDGIKKLFHNLSVTNFWDCGIRTDKPDFDEYKAYLEEDWDFYDDLINNRVDDVTVVAPRAGSVGQYYNADNEDNSGDGDYLSIVAPHSNLLASANGDGEIHDASYVIVYRSSAGRIIFAGDSNSKTWEYIIDNHKDLVSNAAVLFAPHHGRKANQDFSYLDTVNPRVSFFGCASSEHLGYSAWQNRNLLYFTNNQCGNVHVYPEDKEVEVYIENENYARAYTKGYAYQKDGYWFLCKV